ncbi:embryonic protein UVS.2-like [Gastrophryne carolinensis]
MGESMILLLLVASLIQACLGVPLQINFEDMNKEVEIKKEMPRIEPPLIFNLITKANKDSKVPMHEGDIALDVSRSAIKCDDGGCRWKKNSTRIVNVPYTLSSSYSSSDVSVILGAFQEFATLTCIRFIPQTNESDYLQIMSSPGCWSYIGKRGGGQTVSVESRCMVHGSVQHELTHALGFYHEQSRSDRDNYVTIVKENILPGAEPNFNSYDTLNQGIEYDFGSVMHYPSDAFSKDPDNLFTIIPKSNAAIGQRYGLSTLDVAKINKLYQCGVCGTLLGDSSGSLTSSNYPSNYPNASSCLWLIRVPGNQVLLQFSAFDVQPTSGCTSDYLKIYDGPSTSSPLLLDRSCGAGQLPSIISSQNFMLLQFVSDNMTEATGFKASYSTVTCGSVLTNPVGTFSTPNYPSLYPSNMYCTWSISAPLGFVVSLNMTDFNVEPKSTCIFDYVLAYDGAKTTSPLIGRYCGKTSLPSFTSTGNNLLVQFHSDDSVQLKGFLAKYVFADKGYGQETWLITPMRHPQTAAEVCYNSACRKTICIVERTIGLLKARFLCLAVWLDQGADAVQPRGDVQDNPHLLSATQSLHTPSNGRARGKATGA